MTRIGIALVVAVLTAGGVRAEGLPSILSEEGQAFLVGLRAVEGDAGPEPAPRTEPRKGKSSKRAFLLSALVPGLGEWYAGSKKRGLAFLGAEAALWGMWAIWKGKGKDLEEEFRAVADEHWDPEDYILWRESTISNNSSITHALPCSSEVREVYIPARREWINTSQSGGLGSAAFGGCAPSQIQQYYELLGKYDQFVAGWDDLKRVRRDGSIGNAAVPTEVDSVENFHSERRLRYEDDRDESNRFLKRASTISGVILINHVISAIDAARVARARAAGADEAALQRRTRLALVMQPWVRSHVPMLVAYKPLD
ncbi:MAG: hypothetical protein J4F35_10860 [Candidatus Latescibacteria bacterium]|nr:hypothetical protein [Candidatus Latescibacterota bacterium]